MLCGLKRQWQTHCNDQDIIGDIELAACVLSVLTLEGLAILTGDASAYWVHIYTLSLQVVALHMHTDTKHFEQYHWEKHVLMPLYSCEALGTSIIHSAGQRCIQTQSSAVMGRQNHRRAATANLVQTERLGIYRTVVCWERVCVPRRHCKMPACTLQSASMHAGKVPTPHIGSTALNKHAEQDSTATKQGEGHTVSGMWLLTGSTMDRGSTVPVAALGSRGVYRK